jgi:hypothetical protein
MDVRWEFRRLGHDEWERVAVGDLDPTRAPVWPTGIGCVGSSGLTNLCPAVSDSRLSGSSRSRGRSLGCRSKQYGGHHGTRLETLAGCFRSCVGPGWWVSLDLSSPQRNSAFAAVLESL